MTALLRSELSRELFRITLIGIGCIAIGTGTWALVTGVAGLPGTGDADPTVDQELRFLAVFWLGFGVALLYLRNRVTADLVKLTALAIFLGGVARGLSLVMVGTPHPMFVALMCAELIGPFWLVFWHSRLDATR